MTHSYPADCKVLIRADLDYQQFSPVLSLLNDWSVAVGVPLLTFELESGEQPAFCFQVAVPRQTIAETLRRFLPAELIVNVLIDGQSWTNWHARAA